MIEDNKDDRKVKMMKREREQKKKQNLREGELRTRAQTRNLVKEIFAEGERSEIKER